MTPNNQEVFGDEDLKNMRSELTIRNYRWTEAARLAFKLDALLARLKAAEQVCEAAQDMQQLTYSARFNARLDAWRRSAGK